MKRFLLATAAVIALAVTPIAIAQTTTPPPATAPYTTPLPDDPATPQDESLSAQPDTTQSQSTLTTPGAPETTDPMPSTTAQTTTDATTQAQTDTDVDTTTQAQATTDPNAMAQTTDPNTAAATAYGSTTTDSYADASSHMGENTLTPASLEQHARDAGMDRLPMTAQEVCMPREISLTTSGTRLNRDKQHMLINAADRASTCEIQRVTISSPNGRADQARQLLIDHGVDASMIEVVDSETGGLEVDMNFAGIATSSEMYAQMFSTQQLASYQPGATTQGYAPSTAPAPAPNTYQPSPSAPPASDPSMNDPSAPPADPEPMEDMDGMSPTSSQPTVTPGLYDA